MLRALDTTVLDALSVLLRRFGLSKAADLVDDELIYRDLLVHIKLKRAMGGTCSSGRLSN